MPNPGAQPKPNYDALDLGRGADGIWRIGTLYDDGSYVIWNGEGDNEELAYIGPGEGREAPVDIGGGRAAVVNPDGSLDVFDIKHPPPQYQGTPAAGPGASGPAAAPKYPTVGKGVYPSQFGGQTVAPSTPATIGAGTAGLQYGYGGDWNRPGELVKINEQDLPNLFDPKLAPGYIPGSATYNQYRLDQGGLFGTIPGQQGVVNLRYGLGGTGDPTTGGEVQTPQRWITGNPGDSAQAMQGDAAWRARYGGAAAPAGGRDVIYDYPLTTADTTQPHSTGPLSGNWKWDVMATPKIGGGGGWNLPPYTYEGTGGGGTGGSQGAGGGFFGSNRTSNWGQGDQAGTGLDYIANLFLRSDTATGIGTPAWSAPIQMWQGLLDQIRQGNIYVADPQAWAMLSQKFGTPITPQTIGGAALNPQNVQPGTGNGIDDAIANANAADAADRAAYWAYHQALVRQGDETLAQAAAKQAWTQTFEEAKQAWTQKYQTAGLTGMLDGQQTLASKQLENQTALGLMGLQAQLQGPRNWAAYQKTFGATPQGLKDVMAAFQGRYQLPTGQGAQATAQGGQQSVAGLAGDILSGTYGQDGQSGQALINPRQVDVSNWARMQPSQREMILGQYEQSGWYGPDVENLIKGAAPRYSGPTTANYQFFQS